MATKKRTWEQNEQKVAGKATKPVKVCNKACECKDKVMVSVESIEDGRITRNELLKEITDLKELIALKKARISDLELKWEEQDNIIDDMFEDLIELSDKADGYKLGRNISIAFNVILIVLLVFFLI